MLQIISIQLITMIKKPVKVFKNELFAFDNAKIKVFLTLSTAVFFRIV